MVEVIQTERRGDSIQSTGGSPRVEIHHIKRDIFGNGIAVKVYGELKIAAKEIVYARELGLNTLQVLLLTPESGDHFPWDVKKWIYHKGEYDNYASIDIYSAYTGQYQMRADGRVAIRTVPSVLPDDGSLWLDFIALGE